MADVSRLAKVRAALKAAEPSLRAVSVTRCGVFGSLARGEDRPDSDVDVVIDWDLNVPVTWRSGAVQVVLEDAIGGGVDFIARPIRKPRLRRAVERDCVDVF